MARFDGRGANSLRPIKFERCVNRYAEGSCRVTWGNTIVLATASVEEKVPPFLRGQGTGWVTAEYSMLPRATKTRTVREITKGKPNSRSSEISRLIGRSLRAATNLANLGERTITIDCDVLQADGGTRTASISAGFVALFDAFRFLTREKLLAKIPCTNQIAAVSVGKVGGEILLDLCYEEDSTAEADANFVMTGKGEFVEFQGTGEGGTISYTDLASLVDLAQLGTSEILKMQREILCLTEKEEKLLV